MVKRSNWLPKKGLPDQRYNRPNGYRSATYDGIQYVQLLDIAGALSMEVHNGITSPSEEDSS